MPSQAQRGLDVSRFAGRNPSKPTKQVNGSNAPLQIHTGSGYLKFTGSRSLQPAKQVTNSSSTRYTKHTHVQNTRGFVQNSTLMPQPKMPTGPASSSSSTASEALSSPTYQLLNNALDNAFNRLDLSAKVHPEVVEQIRAQVKWSFMNEIKMKEMGTINPAQPQFGPSLPMNKATRYAPSSHNSLTLSPKEVISQPWSPFVSPQRVNLQFGPAIVPGSAAGSYKPTASANHSNPSFTPARSPIVDKTSREHWYVCFVVQRSIQNTTCVMVFRDCNPPSNNVC